MLLCSNKAFHKSSTLNIELYLSHFEKVFKLVDAYQILLKYAQKIKPKSTPKFASFKTQANCNKYKYVYGSISQNSYGSINKT